jgi:hypothetical protein
MRSYTGVVASIKNFGEYSNWASKYSSKVDPKVITGRLSFSYDQLADRPCQGKMRLPETPQRVKP